MRGPPGQRRAHAEAVGVCAPGDVGDGQAAHVPGHRRERATLAGWACHVGFHSDLNGGVTEDLSAEGGTRLGLEVAL